ncbi:MAG: ABC transporter substrate-binding protein [Wenzhouxiangellaceae bacterium]|nr:ABC transporter substrate-binding protein [Wenzhouxiangellaceae bacterium]
MHPRRRPDRIAGPAPNAQRRRLLAASAAGLALGLLPGCSSSTPLRMAYEPWAGYQFLVLAERDGLIPSGTLEWVDLSVDARIHSAANEELDLVQVTLDELMAMRAHGADMQGVLVFNTSAGGDAVLARPERASLDALAGARIGVETSTIGTLMLDAVLREAGLTREQVEIVYMGNDHPAAWQAGGMDAIIAYQPSVYQLEQLGLVRLFDSCRVPGLIIDLLAAGPRARAHRSALKALIDGHFDELQRWKTNPIDSAHRLGGLMQIPAREVRTVLAGLNLPDRDFNRHLLDGPAGTLAEAVERINPVLLAAGQIERPVSVDGLFSAEFL